VLLARQVTCQTEVAVESLQQLSDVQDVVVITSGHSCVNARWAPSVSCIDDNTAVPGLTLAAVKSGFDSLAVKHVCADSKKGKHAAWFFQQFLKFGYAAMRGDVDWTLAWDGDMILVNKYTPLNLSTGKVLFHSGGFAPSAADYSPPYQLLTGMDMKLAQDNTTYVVHHMLFYRPYLQEMLDLFASATPGAGIDNVDDANPGLPRWAWNAMIAACVSSSDRNRGARFSEYSYYASFVFSRHPDSALPGPHLAHVRHFPGTIGFGKRTGTDGACIAYSSFLDEVHAWRANYTMLGFDQHDGDREDWWQDVQWQWLWGSCLSLAFVSWLLMCRGIGRHRAHAQ